MWTARGKIILFMETTQSNCFQEKMGALPHAILWKPQQIVQNIGTGGGFKITTLICYWLTDEFPFESNLEGRFCSV